MTDPGVERLAGVTLAQSAALLIPFAAVASNNIEARALLLIAALVAALGWEALFGALRHGGPGIHGVTTALIVATLCPLDIALWQVIVAVSLGTVIGESVFGGRGFGFLNPATVALALLVISFPQVHLPSPSLSLALATMPGAILLLVLGLVSGRVLLAVAIAAIAVFMLRGQGVDVRAIATGIAFGLVFLIADPVAAAATNWGRWLYGALAGGLIAVFSPTGDVTTQAVVFAALLAGIFAPLIDHLAVLADAARRRLRHHV